MRRSYLNTSSTCMFQHQKSWSDIVPVCTTGESTGNEQLKCFENAHVTHCFEYGSYVSLTAIWLTLHWLEQIEGVAELVVEERSEACEGSILGPRPGVFFRRLWSLGPSYDMSSSIQFYCIFAQQQVCRSLRWHAKNSSQRRDVMVSGGHGSPGGPCGPGGPCSPRRPSGPWRP